MSTSSKLVDTVAGRIVQEAYLLAGLASFDEAVERTRRACASGVELWNGAGGGMSLAGCEIPDDDQFAAAVALARVQWSEMA